MAVKKVTVEFIGNTKDIDKAVKGFDDVNARVVKTEKSTSKFNKTLKTVGGTIVGIFAAEKLIDFGKQIISVTANFQKMRAVLKTTLGSGSEADKAFARIRKFAADTPFQVQELTSSFVKLANQGFVPTNKQLKSLGDLAASTGKEFDQLAEAIIDAQVGEFERLKEFGIRAQKAGDQVKFTFKGVETQVKFTQEAIRGYILGIGEAAGVSGSMAEISETLGGKISNLEDAWDSFLFSLGQEANGVFGTAISGLTSILEALTDQEDQINATDAAIDKLNKQYAVEQQEVDKLFNILKDETSSRELRNFAIETLNGTYGEYLPNLLDEQSSIKDIDTAQKALNENLLKGISLRLAQDEIADQIKAIKKESIEAREVLEKFGFQIDEQTGFFKDTQGAMIEYNGELISAAQLNHKLVQEQNNVNIAIVETTRKYQTAVETIEEGNKKAATSTENFSRSFGISINGLIPVLDQVGRKVSDLRKEIEGFTSEEAEKELRAFFAKEDLKIAKMKEGTKRQLEEEELRFQQFLAKDGLLKEEIELAEEIHQQEILQIKKDAALETIATARNAAIEALNIGNSIAGLRTENELQNIQKRFKAGKITKDEAEKQEREALARSADRQKIFASFAVLVDAAAAGVKALAGSPPPANFIAAAAVAAAAGVQIAKINSADVPSFAKGTKDAPGGLSIVGEEGQEAMFVPQHAKILPASQTKKYSDVFDAMYENRFDDLYIPRTDVAKIAQESMERNTAENMVAMMGINGLKYNDHYLRQAVKEGNKISINNTDRVVRAIKDSYDELSFKQRKSW